MILIDETKLDPSLLVEADGKKTLDFSKLKTVEDVNSVLTAKLHVKQLLNALKLKYRNVDILRYNNLINAEFEANKDVLQNPVYKNLLQKYSLLNNDYANLQKEIHKRDQEIFNSLLKESFRKIKGVQETALDDILYRSQLAGFTKTLKGILDKNGQSILNFVEGLRNSAPHLFKQTVGSSNLLKSQNLINATKNNSLLDVLKNCPSEKR